MLLDIYISKPRIIVSPARNSVIAIESRQLVLKLLLSGFNRVIIDRCLLTDPVGQDCQGVFTAICPAIALADDRSVVVKKHVV